MDLGNSVPQGSVGSNPSSRTSPNKRSMQMDTAIPGHAVRIDVKKAIEMPGIHKQIMMRGKHGRRHAACG